MPPKVYTFRTYDYAETGFTDTKSEYMRYSNSADAHDFFYKLIPLDDEWKGYEEYFKSKPVFCVKREGNKCELQVNTLASIIKMRMFLDKGDLISLRQCIDSVLKDD